MSSEAKPHDTDPEARLATSPDGIRVAFDLYPSASRLGVLIVPGFWRTRTYSRLRAIASRVSRDLASCAVMDLRGHGQSGGVFEFNRHEHEDVASVTRKFVEATGVERVLLLGFSAGGAISVSTAARHHDLPLAGLLLVSTVCDFLQVVPRPNPLTIGRHLSFGEAVKVPRFRWPGSDRLSARDDVGSIPVPICLLHAKNDWLVSHRHSEELARRARAAELHLLDVPGRFHADALFEVVPDLVWPIVEEFVRRVATR